MSNQLAISSALSVILMAGYVLFGGDARQVDLRTHGSLLPAVSAPALLPKADILLPR